MTDADVDADLAAAFLTPTTPERPDLAARVMDRVRRDDRRRRAVIAASALAGAGLAAALVGAAGLIDPDSLRAVADVTLNPGCMLFVGLALIALAATRHALAET